MRMRSMAACCLLALCTAATVFAEEPPKASPQGGLSPELEAMIEARSLAPQHQQLARFVGDWTITTKLWMGPGATPAESSGTMRAETTFGGRYVEHHSIGEMLGKPFEGRGTFAYDNASKQFVSTSIEMSNGIGMMMQTGTCDEAMTRCTFTGLYWVPASGQQNTVRSVITWTGDDSFKTEGYGTGPDGLEIKVMEFVATRKQ